MKQRGHTVNGAALALCRERLIPDLPKAKIAHAAKQIGVSAELWGKWERGERGIGDENLEMLVSLFGLDSPAVLLAATAFEAEAEAERQRTRRNRPAVAA